MIQDFVIAWDTNKTALETYFSTHTAGSYCSYRRLVELLFEIVVNPYLQSAGLPVFDLEKIHEIDDGDYQGSLLYAIPQKTYQPSCYEYVLTYVEYGSCPFCDELAGIADLLKDNLPDADSVSLLMTLSLHILQHCKIPYSYEEEKGW